MPIVFLPAAQVRSVAPDGLVALRHGPAVTGVIAMETLPHRLAEAVRRFDRDMRADPGSYPAHRDRLAADLSRAASPAAYGPP